MKMVQGWPKLWTNFKVLIGIFNQSAGPSLAIWAHPRVQSLFLFDAPDALGFFSNLPTDELLWVLGPSLCARAVMEEWATHKQILKCRWEAAARHAVHVLLRRELPQGGVNAVDGAGSISDADPRKIVFAGSNHHNHNINWDRDQFVKRELAHKSLHTHIHLGRQRAETM